MAGLTSLLLFAFIFYFMMRLGCGRHMIHGKTETKEYFDPVCGTKVEDDQGYGKLHEGKLYRFCTKKHLDEFDRNPEKHINNTR